MANDLIKAVLLCCCAGIIIFAVFSMLAPDDNDSDVNTTSNDNLSVDSSQNPSTSSSSSDEEGIQTITIENISLSDDGGSFAGSDYAILTPEGKDYMIGLNKHDYESIIKYKGYNPIGKTLKVELGDRRSGTGNMKIYDYCYFYDDNGKQIC